MDINKKIHNIIELNMSPGEGKTCTVRTVRLHTMNPTLNFQIAL